MTPAVSEHYVLAFLVGLALIAAAARVLGAIARSLGRAPPSGGGAIQRIFGGEEPEEDVVTLLRRGAFVGELHARTPPDAIAELVRALGSLLKGRKRFARDAVLERELLAATGVGDEVAIPHAEVAGVARPLLALGRSAAGIDFDAPDGKQARFVFLVLIPPGAHADESRILTSIARAMLDPRARQALMEANGIDEVARVLSESARRTRSSNPPARRPR
jgi:mannitol/fructose-specific phosphotransferase system IIA component (Ntr-type)